MTLAAIPTELPLGVHQWRAQTLQLINWGGFESYHRLDFDENATLISGGSGTGKSTLLDAHIAVLMDSSRPFNTVSNDQGTGRVRSEEKRNVLSYMRGKTDSYRDDSTGQKRAVVLRGDSRATWSAIGMTRPPRHGDTRSASPCRPGAHSKNNSPGSAPSANGQSDTACSCTGRNAMSSAPLNHCRSSDKPRPRDRGRCSRPTLAERTPASARPRRTPSQPLSRNHNPRCRPQRRPPR